MLRALSPRRPGPISLAALGALCLVACVPEGPPTPDHGAAPVRTSSPSPAKTAPIKAVALPARPAITEPFEDSFDRAELGPDYNALSPA